MARRTAALRSRHGCNASKPARRAHVRPRLDSVQHAETAVGHAFCLPARSCRHQDGPRIVAREGIDLIIVMSHQATKAEIDAVVDRVHEIGLKTEISRGEERTLVAVVDGNASTPKQE